MPSSVDKQYKEVLKMVLREKMIQKVSQVTKKEFQGFPGGALHFHYGICSINSIFLLLWKQKRGLRLMMCSRLKSFIILSLISHFLHVRALQRNSH